jgi:PAS domain-containing protein
LLSRKYTEQALREQQERIELTTLAAGTGLWDITLKSGNVWVNSKSREIFEFAPHEEITYDRCLQMIHPDDVEKVHQAFRQSIDHGDGLMIDFRIVLANGTVRWICSRGQRRPGPGGEQVSLMGVSLKNGQGMMDRDFVSNLSFFSIFCHSIYW